MMNFDEKFTILNTFSEIFLVKIWIFVKKKIWKKNGQKILLNRKDTGKKGKYYVLRTYFTHYNELSDLNGMICFLEGISDSNNKSYSCSGNRVI